MSTMIEADTLTQSDPDRAKADNQKQDPPEFQSSQKRRRVGRLDHYRTWFACKLQRLVEGIFYRRQVERLYLVFGGHIFFQSLNAAVRFDLFSLLKANPGLTRHELASRLEIDEQPMRILLLSLTSAKFLRKRGERYFNIRIYEELLVADSPKNILPYVHLENHAMYKAMPHFYDALKKNQNVGISEFPGDEPTFYERLSHDPKLEEVFQDAMSALSVQTNKMLATFLDLSDVDHLVDVGGGDGTNIMALGNRFPHLQGTVFDLPSVCDIAREKIHEAGEADRMNAIAGNCFEDNFPEGADCFLFSHFFTIWSEEKDRLLLKKSYDALPSGGKVVIFNMMQSDDETGPLSAAVGSPYFLTLATGEGMLYTWREYEQWMREAGFSSVRRQVLPRDHGAIIGIK